jgi:hypothetical protein
LDTRASPADIYLKFFWRRYSSPGVSRAPQIPRAAFSWGALYVAAMAAETVVVKRAIDTLQLSTWSLVCL